MFAENTPDVVGPDGPRRDGRKTRTVYFAGCAWQVPVFWLFCYDFEDLTDYECDDGALVPTLVTPMERVRARLEERDEPVRSLFPQCIEADGTLKDALTAALSWLRTGHPPEGVSP
jgi:hypothetical protein